MERCWSADHDIGSSLLLVLCETRVQAEPRVFQDETGSTCFNVCTHSCWEEPLAASLMLFCTQADPVYLQALQQSNGKGGGGASHPCSAALSGTWHQCEVSSAGFSQWHLCQNPASAHLSFPSIAGLHPSMSSPDVTLDLGERAQQ